MLLRNRHANVAPGHNKFSFLLQPFEHTRHRFRFDTQKIGQIGARQRQLHAQVGTITRAMGLHQLAQNTGQSGLIAFGGGLLFDSIGFGRMIRTYEVQIMRLPRL